MKLISFENLSLFWEKVKAWFNPLLEALDTKIDKKVWTGTQEELEKAIAAGEVDEKTICIVTDDDDKEIIYEFATLADIRALFGLS